MDLANLIKGAKLSSAQKLKLRSVLSARNEIEIDWQSLLKTLGPNSFRGSFASFHVEFWDWLWERLHRKKLDGDLGGVDTTLLAIWPRGGGKSMCSEWAAIMEAVLLGQGYTLYVCATQEAAQRHVSNIARRLESPEITQHYPSLSRFKVGKFGNRLAWREGALHTESGWGILAFGLDTGIRGTRLDELRPSLIILDDIDDIKHSPAMVEKNIEILTRSVFPAGTKDTLIIGAQNLIHRHSVFNQMVTGKVRMLSRRTISGPFPAFQNLKTEFINGRDMIVDGIPVWDDMDLEACQQFIDKSTLPAFLAEYQHDFTGGEQGLVIPEYDDSKHVISWSQFKEIFGARYIPRHWKIAVGHDLGYTTNHRSAWSFIATASDDSPFPGMQFLYRGLTYEAPLLDEMAEDVIKRLGPDPSVGRSYSELPQIEFWRMSHEKLGERKTYNTKYGFAFRACMSRKNDGIAQWRHLLRLDESKPDPFRRGYMGHARLYFIVGDDQMVSPRDDGGLKLHREQVQAWRWRPVSLTDSGMAKDEPVKAFEDTCDSLRMITAEWGPSVAPKTYEQKLQDALPEFLRDESLANEKDPEMLARKHLTWYHQIAKVKKRLKTTTGHWADEFLEPHQTLEDMTYEIEEGAG
jgi:hypothetical protein